MPSSHGHDPRRRRRRGRRHHPRSSLLCYSNDPKAYEYNPYRYYMRRRRHAISVADLLRRLAGASKYRLSGLETGRLVVGATAVLVIPAIGGAVITALCAQLLFQSWPTWQKLVEHFGPRADVYAPSPSDGMEPAILLLSLIFMVSSIYTAILVLRK